MEKKFNLEAEVLRHREAIRSQKIEEAAEKKVASTHPSKSIIHSDIPKPDSFAETPEHAWWLRTRQNLRHLDHVIEWIRDKNPDLHAQIHRLEGKCLRVARMGPPKDYKVLHQEYVKTIGEILELYYVELGTWSTKKISSPKHGIRELWIALTKEECAAIPNDNCPRILVREFPAFICIPPESIGRDLMARDFFGGEFVSA